MAHPHAAHRQHLVERQRVHHITGGEHTGATKVHGDAASDAALVKKMVRPSALKVSGKKAKHRVDHRARGGRVTERARGGRTKHKGHTTVNVITGHPMGGAAPMATPPMPMPPPRPPMAAPALPPGSSSGRSACGSRSPWRASCRDAATPRHGAAHAHPQRWRARLCQGWGG